MIIPGQAISDFSFISGMAFKSQIQPAGVDMTLCKIFSFKSAGTIDGDNSRRELPHCEEILFPDDGPLHLGKGPYKVRFNELVKIPRNAAAIAVPRSSLLRMGASMHNALWDPGYEGRSEGLLLVSNPHGINIFKDAKIAQLVFIRLENPASKLYNGKYQGENK